MQEYIYFKLTAHFLVKKYIITYDIISAQTLSYFKPMQLCFIQYLHVSVEVNHHQIINTIFKKKVNIVLMA